MFTVPVRAVRVGVPTVTETVNASGVWGRLTSPALSKANTYHW